MQLQQYRSLGPAFRAQAAEHAAVLQQVGLRRLCMGGRVLLGRRALARVCCGGAANGPVSSPVPFAL